MTYIKLPALDAPLFANGLRIMPAIGRALLTFVTSLFRSCVPFWLKIVALRHRPDPLPTIEPATSLPIAGARLCRWRWIAPTRGQAYRPSGGQWSQFRKSVGSILTTSG